MTDKEVYRDQFKGLEGLPDVVLTFLIPLAVILILPKFVQFFRRWFDHARLSLPQEVEARDNGTFYLQPNEMARNQQQECSELLPGEPNLRGNFYNIKSENIEHHAPFGKGLVVIVANFTGEFKGYQKDTLLIKNFFQQQLKYTVMTYTNLCRREFHDMITSTGRMLEQENFDRFFLFVLSHGSEDGLTMCAEGNDKLKEKDSRGNLLKMPVEVLTDKFSHDEVPSMKDYPKCLITQMCMGNHRVKATVDIISPELEDANTGPPQDQQIEETGPSQDITPVGADVLHGYSSGIGTVSWVTDNGSWYIQEMIEVFRMYYRTETVTDMLAEVNDRVTKKSTVHDDKGKKELVYQLPGMTNNLRKKFFLKLPTVDMRDKVCAHV